MESSDGSALYFVKDVSMTSIWRMSLNGGGVSPVVDGLGKGMWGYWALAGGSLFFGQKNPNGSSPADLYVLNLKTGVKRKMGSTEFGVNGDDKGLTVSADGKWLLYAQRNIDRSSIMIVEGANWPEHSPPDLCPRILGKNNWTRARCRGIAKVT